MASASLVARRLPWPRAGALLGLLCLLPGGFAAAQQRPDPSFGVVVDVVQPGSVAAVAGLRQDDVIVGWRAADGRPAAQGPSAGTLPDPWAFEQFVLEVAPRSRVALDVQRAAITLALDLPVRTSRLGVSVIPMLAADLGAQWRRALDAPSAASVAAGQPPDALAPLTTQLIGQGRNLDAAWLRLRRAERLISQRAFDAADRHLAASAAEPRVASDAARLGVVRVAMFDAALRQSRWDAASALADTALAGDDAATDTPQRASWLLKRAVILRQQGRHDVAQRDAEAALAIRRALAPGSWDEADSLAELGRIAVARRRLDEAGSQFEAALAIVRGAPSTIETVRLEFALADVEWRRGRLPDAERRVRRLLELTRDLAPESADQARNLNLLGVLRSQSGDLPAAERAFQQSWVIHARLDPGGVDEGTALNNLGIAAMQRGRYSEAESFYRRSLAIKERLGVPPLDRVSSYGNLGLVSIERRDFESARRYFTRALELVRQAAPDTLQVGGILSNLARVERLSGNLVEAERLARESLEVRARLAPNTVLHAFTLTELGKVLEARGALGGAAESHRHALAIREQLSPDGSNVADSLDALGRLAERRADLEEAARLHDRAGALWQRVAPGSVYEGMNLMARARLDAARGRADAARERFGRATEIFDGLTGSVGGSFDTQADFRNGLASSYGEYAAFLLRQGDAVEAFRVSERARTRVFLAMLAERDVAVGADAPPDLEATRRALTQEYERVQGELSTLSPVRDAARIDERNGRLGEVRLQLAATQADIARASPRLGALRPAEPLDVDAARRLLPAGTAAIAYLIGEQSSHAFVITSATFSVFPIPWGRAALAERVERLQRLIDRRDDALEPLTALAADLYRSLVAPADAVLSSHARLLVVPDGPLHQLPFAALVRDTPAARKAWQYIVEWRPVHQVPSLTFYGRLDLPARLLDARARLVAVGSPVYSSPGDAATTNGAARADVAAALPPLPGSRREVEALGALYGTRMTSLLDGEASETRVRQAITDADVVHIAVHGLVNAASPLDSALALSTQPGDDAGSGLLQAWEIFEQVRLRARLVVLSACNTAGSRESGGEGLLGLTRAFQFAGAPSVVASLWRVPDEITPVLMREFHRHVRRGVPLDDALARAQRAMLRDPATAHPYNWAAFVLSGRN